MSSTPTTPTCVEFLASDQASAEAALFSEVFAEEVVEAACVYGPTDKIPITNPDFVPEGFHETCLDEYGGIKLTDENRHLYIDLGYLTQIHIQNHWGTEKGVTYTRTMTGCPDGRAPTQEVLLDMDLRGFKLAGRVVMEGGCVKDYDTANALENHGGGADIMDTFDERFSWEAHQGRRKSITPDTKSPDGQQHYITESIMDPESTLKLSTPKAGIPAGTYRLKEANSRKSLEGFGIYALCDEPECCLMSHALLMVVAGSTAPQSEYIGKFFRDRVMYDIEDVEHGNSDVCYHCLSKAGAK